MTTPDVASALGRLRDFVADLAGGRDYHEAQAIEAVLDLALVTEALAVRDGLLLAIRRDHMDENDGAAGPCAWCEDLIAALPEARTPAPETTR